VDPKQQRRGLITVRREPEHWYNGCYMNVPSREIVINVPETILLAEKTDAVSFGMELRMLAAVKLYELGRLSSGRAAELAGIPRVVFLHSLGRYRVFPLAAELAELEEANASRN
jgi:predicted HTH domain antitoxin